MTTKEAVIQFINQLPDSVSFTSIVDALRGNERQFEVAADPLPSTEDVTDDEWMAAIAEDWALDLGDPRQDIYTATEGKATE